MGKINVNNTKNINNRDLDSTNGDLMTVEETQMLCDKMMEKIKRLGYRIDEWDKDFFEYINNLKNKKDVILTGDLNVARENIDIFDPKGREKLAGFTQREKESFNKFLKTGYIDCFRNLHPNDKKFTFFSKRAKGNREGNKGWRLDYFVTNKNLKNIEVKECDIIDKDKYDASDHIPIVLTFNCKK